MAGSGACRSGPAEAVKGCVLAQLGDPGHAGRELLQFPAGNAESATTWMARPGSVAMAPAMRRASHSREDEVVPLMTSLASTESPPAGHRKDRRQKRSCDAVGHKPCVLRMPTLTLSFHWGLRAGRCA